MLCKYLASLILLVAPAVCLQKGRFESKAALHVECLADGQRMQLREMENSTQRRERETSERLSSRKDANLNGLGEQGAAAHCPNPAQKRYEVLRDFVGYMAKHPELRWSLSAGSLLGAMRQKPPGFIQVDNDIDVIMPAKDLFQLHDILFAPVYAELSTLGITGDYSLLDADVGPATKAVRTDACCGFGWRFVHRQDECAYMDIMALSLQKRPFGMTHYRSYEQLWAVPQQHGGGQRKHRSGDTTLDAMMMKREHWQTKEGSGKELVWTGKQKSMIQRAFLTTSEFLPLKQMQMYGLTVNIPHYPWRYLTRLYGADCDTHDAFDRDHSDDPKWILPAKVNFTESVTPLLRRDQI